jgi:hypothetical protein
MRSVVSRAHGVAARASHLLFVTTMLACSGDVADSGGDASVSSQSPATTGDGGAAQQPAKDGGTQNAKDGGTQSSTDGGGASGRDAGSPPATQGGALAVAQKLGRDHFLIGLGNDLADNHDQDGAYTLGVSLDLHYAYLVGLAGEGGWPDWNANGTFVNVLADAAKRHGTVPMFTLYSMAAHGESNTAALTDDAYMRAYWNGAKLMFQRLGDFGDPAVVHFEPDFWAYVQQASGGNPSSLPVHVKALAPDCADQPDNVVGMGKCLVALARKYAPKTLVGFHASTWADGDPSKVGAFLAAIGGADADLVFIDMLDRDAGCFEAHTDPGCQRGGTTGWYLDESNQTSPNFNEQLASAAAIGKAVGRPMMWWQLPLGVASDTPGGSAGHYRDNRVKYLFSHVDAFIAAGGVGAVFGTGAGNQTDIVTDGGQFKRAVGAYFAAPTRL